MYIIIAIIKIFYDDWMTTDTGWIWLFILLYIFRFEYRCIVIVNMLTIFLFLNIFMVEVEMEFFFTFLFLHFFLLVLVILNHHMKVGLILKHHGLFYQVEIVILLFKEVNNEGVGFLGEKQLELHRPFYYFIDHLLLLLLICLREVAVRICEEKPWLFREVQKLLH